MKEKKVVCLDCGYQYSGEQDMCPMCGSKRRNSMGKKSPRPAGGGGGKNTKLIVGVIIVVVLLGLFSVLAVVYGIMSSAGENPADISSSSSAQEQQPLPLTPDSPAISLPDASVSVLPAPDVSQTAPDVSQTTPDESLKAPDVPLSTEAEAMERCQTIMKDCITRMEDAMPRLVEEFKAEAEGVTDGRVLSLACNQKIGVLSELCDEGLEAIRAVADQLPDRKLNLSDYENKLNQFCDEMSAQIRDVYFEYYVNNAA